MRLDTMKEKPDESGFRPVFLFPNQYLEFKILILYLKTQKHINVKNQV